MIVPGLTDEQLVTRMKATFRPAAELTLEEFVELFGPMPRMN